jgi:branched-chain amino acid transport system permease protein
MALVLSMVAVLYFLLERARTAPWGRVMSAIRENELAARAAGKNVEQFRIQSFVTGCALMGLAGGLTSHYLKFIDPQAADPLTTTFLVFVMLIIGGSGNNKGAILGAFLMWTIWSATEIVTSRLPDDWAIRSAYMRVFLIGLLLQIVLQKFPGGILPERRLRAVEDKKNIN